MKTFARVETPTFSRGEVMNTEFMDVATQKMIMMNRVVRREVSWTFPRTFPRRRERFPILCVGVRRVKSGNSNA